MRDFRNLAHVDLTLPGEGLVVVGDNGQGKTNLLESIYYLSLLRSVRGTAAFQSRRACCTRFRLLASREKTAW